MAQPFHHWAAARWCNSCAIDTLRPPYVPRMRTTDSQLGLAGLCIPVVFDCNRRPAGAHADDEFVVETAINGHADAVATFNLKHLREAGATFGFLARRPGPLVKRIRQ